jgi:hypothetical protein|uniref:Uncharacterized protein n=1 Tax=uncultured microorganism TaxID=358574 RepID=A0A1L3KS60_9ZZZZ|nr:hypothetical protein [uncultured microorganism]
MNITNLTNYTHVQTIGTAISYTFLVPALGLILTLVVIGAVWVRTKNLDFALLAGTTLSMILYALAPTVISVAIPVGLLVLTFLASLEHAFLKHH